VVAVSLKKKGRRRSNGGKPSAGTNHS